jgi:50S ribosomal subunit-associated GTPase HflX
MRLLWPQYFQEATAMLFVADAASTPIQLEQAAQALREVLQHAEMQVGPCLTRFNLSPCCWWHKAIIAQQAEHTRHMRQFSLINTWCCGTLLGAAAVYLCTSKLLRLCRR